MRINPAKLRVAYGIFLSALTVIVGIFFIVEAAEIYYGVGSYSRAIIWQHLKYPLILTGVWALCVILGFVFSVLLPATEGKRKPADSLTTLSKLLARIPAGEGAEFASARKRLRVWNLVRFAVWCFVAAFLVLSAIMSCVYLFNAAHFVETMAEGMYAEMLAMLKHVLPWLLLSFAAVIGAVIFECVSAKYVLPVVKRLLVLGKGYPVEEPHAVKKGMDAAVAVVGSKYGVLVIRLALLALGVIFIILGILNGGAGDVLSKAIQICSECVGIA